jgi:hypothetical protein
MPPSARCSTYAKPETTGPFTAPADALRSKVHSDASVVRQSVFSGRGSPESLARPPTPHGLSSWVAPAPRRRLGAAARALRAVRQRTANNEIADHR